MKDPDIIRLLQKLLKPVFFTLDSDFFSRKLCHHRYALVYLAVDQYMAAAFVRRYLNHPSFDTQAKRLGTVVRVGNEKLKLWSLNVGNRQEMKWPEADGSP